jgi:diguanylate cyclase (GGDEF)-like protein/PAS domain S-box-containing protein
VVEDSESDTQLFLRELRNAGYEVAFEQVETAEEMKFALDEKAWDIVISDYNLPQFNGRAALELLKKTKLDIPFIVASGAIGEETAVAMMKAGAHDYLVKSNLARLGLAVTRELEQAKERRDRKQAEQALRETEDQLRQLSRAVEQNPASIIITDKDGRIEYVNSKFTAISGYTLDEVRGKVSRVLKPGKTPPEIHADLWRTIMSGREWRGDIINRKKDGTPYWENALISAITDANGVITHFVSVHEDITARKEAEEKIRLLNAELEQLAITDHLTNLYNRRHFMQRGVEEFRRAQRSKRPLSLLMLDIDQFKNINDTHGHEAGDFALKQVAETLRSNLREIDIIGRMGGDEFTVLLPDTALNDAFNLAERVRLDIEQTALQILGEVVPIFVTVSIGVAASTGKLTHIDKLLKDADRALYQAKRAGRNRVVKSATGSRTRVQADTILGSQTR